MFFSVPFALSLLRRRPDGSESLGLFRVCSSSPLMIQKRGFKRQRKKPSKHKGTSPYPRKKKGKRYSYEPLVWNPFRHNRMSETIDHLMKRDLYTPEAIGGKKLALLANRMVRFGYEEEDLLRRYAERAVKLAPGLETKQFALLLNSMERTNFRHDGMLEAFAQHIPARLSEALPLEFGMICRGFAHFNFGSKRLFRRLSEEMPHKLPYFSSRELTSVAFSFAKLDFRDPVFFDDLADEVAARLDEFRPYELSIVARSFARVGFTKVAFWKRLVDAMEDQRLSLEDRDLVAFLHALGKVGWRDVDTLERLCATLRSRVKALSVHESTHVLNAGASLDFVDAELFEAIGKKLTEHIDELEPLHVALTVNSYAKLGIYDEALFRKLAERIREIVSQMGGRALTSVIHGFGKLNIRDVELFKILSKEVPKKVDEISPQGIALILSSFGKLRIRSNLMLHLLAPEIQKGLPLLTGQGLALLLSGLGNLESKNEKILQGAVRTVRLLTPELGFRELAAVRQALDHPALQLLDDQLRADLDTRASALSGTMPVESLPRREDTAGGAGRMQHEDALSFSVLPSEAGESKEGSTDAGFSSFYVDEEGEEGERGPKGRFKRQTEEGESWQQGVERAFNEEFGFGWHSGEREEERFRGEEDEHNGSEPVGESSLYFSDNLPDFVPNTVSLSPTASAASSLSTERRREKQEGTPSLRVEHGDGKGRKREGMQSQSTRERAARGDGLAQKDREEFDGPPEGGDSFLAIWDRQRMRTQQEKGQEGTGGRGGDEPFSLFPSADPKSNADLVRAYAQKAREKRQGFQFGSLTLDMKKVEALGERTRAAERRQERLEKGISGNERGGEEDDDSVEWEEGGGLSGTQRRRGRTVKRRDGSSTRAPSSTLLSEEMDEQSMEQLWKKARQASENGDSLSSSSSGRHRQSAGSPSGGVVENMTGVIRGPSLVPDQKQNHGWEAGYEHIAGIRNGRRSHHRRIKS
uniref:RNA-editing substrate-binding complex 6 protein domain-containing protein n=1 Tax=Chromera velia CCMP2878 TaxID=1169474 RepID=A0A0G4G3R5_9ALVE|eukprot:Cvel_20148.t1-p1 / transcript=Cvel_20148.t1 / gene=Cvel_20148 / organism=Chromera_velia_CCMP2878 / gene_product=hypothetical protein / transcript_product=hypothetical protein / location=Cvel_scaffold1788:16240-29642(-) / protein_length=983 / sequence_SO=supercontig / SO=protein_coding / is_pseudo=false